MTAAQGSTKAPPTSMPESAALVVGVEYTMPGDLRFLSHQDELRMLVRGLTRAGWPLLYTRGFNPIPRLSIPLPRSTGIAADQQLAIVELRQSPEPAALHSSLAAALPHQMRLLRLLAPLARRAAPAASVEFAVSLRPDEGQALRARIVELLSQTSVVVTRDMGPDKPARQVDIRPYLQELKLGDGTLLMQLHIANQATARPAEVLQALGLPPEIHSVTRTRVAWELVLEDGANRAPSNPS